MDKQYSSMVVVTTPKKIRICLDSQDLNKVILCPRYQMPTLEEILLRISNTEVFSTLDAKDGFYQVKLDEEKQLAYYILDPSWSLSLSEDAIWRESCTRRI